MIYRIRHQTRYGYSQAASLSQNEVCLHPRATAAQKVRQARLSISPEPAYLHERTDFFGNRVHIFMVQHPHHELRIFSESVVETSVMPAPAPDATPAWETVAARLATFVTEEDLDARQYVFDSPLIPHLPAMADYARASFPPGTTVLRGALDLMNRIYKEFTYEKSATSVDTPIDVVLNTRKGVCQDFAQLHIAGLRTLGLAARYVSGYLETLPPPGTPKLVGADASHAWLSLYVPDIGWIDLDPTNDQIPGERHVTVAWGRDYGDVTPAKGVVMGGGVHSLSVEVDVNPLA